MQALERNQSDSALELFMEAERLGMSKDSLFYFLAETALSHSALDTAMAFNLSIPSPRAGPFRQSVLNQRYRLYAKSGLLRDASLLSDSLEAKPASRQDRKHELDVMLSTGYYGAGNYRAIGYPFSADLGAFRSQGAQFRHRARLLWPLGDSPNVPWSGGLEYDALKSYAQDSLDYRAGLRLKADHLFLDSLSLSLAADIGNVTGSGMVTAYKLESSYLSFSGSRVTMLQGGVEAERDNAWKSRFMGFWISFYQDRSLATGRGINFSLSASAILVDPIRDETTQRIMYVDDVTKTNPVHYRDAGFQDTLPGKGISTFVQYTSNTGLDTAGALSPQSLLTLLPTLGYSIPLPLAFSAEAGCHYVLTVYPEAYRWTEAPLPQSFAEASGDFQGLALNQSDGGRYAATLIRQNGGFQEHYGAEPERETSRLRIDNQLGLELSLRRRWAEWGAVALNGVAKRNWSTLAGIAPIWIPKWDMGAELKWSGSWNWI